MHDSVSFSLSNIFEKLAGGLPDQYFICADNAYPLVGSILKPFVRTKEATFQDAYNYYLSSLRVIIENAFGILVHRWGILWRPLRYEPVRASQIILACVHLHNFIVDNERGGDIDEIYDIPIVTKEGEGEDIGASYEFDLYWQDKHHLGDEYDCQTDNELQTYFVHMLSSRGMYRPNNSRR